MEREENPKLIMLAQHANRKTEKIVSVQCVQCIAASPTPDQAVSNEAAWETPQTQWPALGVSTGGCDATDEPAHRLKAGKADADAEIEHVRVR
jgi:hypothetical protein